MTTSTPRPTPIGFPHQIVDAEATARLNERNRRIAVENQNLVFGERTRREAEITNAYTRGRDDGYNLCLRERHTSGFDWGFVCGGMCSALGAAIVITFHEPLAALVARLLG